MKTTLRIPTEMYSYVEVVVEGELLPEDVARLYHDYTDAFKAKPEMEPEGEGIPRKEYIELYDFYEKHGRLMGDPGIIGKLSPKQLVALNELKLNKKRKQSKADMPGFEGTMDSLNNLKITK